MCPGCCWRPPSAQIPHSGLVILGSGVTRTDLETSVILVQSRPTVPGFLKETQNAKHSIQVAANVDRAGQSC